MPSPIERKYALTNKYALTKIDRGDYFLPSNDAKTIWRIRRYEDGPSYGLMDWPRDLTLWGIWRWAEPVHAGRMGHLDPDDWTRWEHWDDGYESRAEAIQGALKVHA